MTYIFVYKYFNDIYTSVCGEIVNNRKQLQMKENEIKNIRMLTN